MLRTSDRLFAHVAATEAPQGIAALVRPTAATLDDLLRGTPLVLLMAGVQDPGNVGALVRTAEALGATGAAACSAGGIGTANPFGPKALRASAGAALRLPILRGVATSILLAQLRVAGVRVYAASPGCSECSGTVGRRLARARGAADRQRRRGAAAGPGSFRRCRRVYPASGCAGCGCGHGFAERRRGGEHLIV